MRPDFRNWENEIEIFPEVQDRFMLNFRGGTAKGLEIYCKYDQGGKFSWWASYALAYANDDISSLVHDEHVYTEGNGIYPGRYDQRHTMYLDVNFRPNRNWHLNVSWQYHTGWPYTELEMKSGQATDGTNYYYSTYEDFNACKYPPYHRMDVKINRHFYTSHGRISAYIALINIYDRGNVQAIKYNCQWSYYLNRPYLAKRYDYWFKLMPSIGVSWSWNH